MIGLGYGFTIGLVVVVLAIASIGCYMSRRRRDECPNDSEDSPLISLVLMLRQPRYLDDTILRRIASDAFDFEFADGDEDAMDFVVGETPMFLVKIHGRMFLVNNFDRPYLDDVEETAETIGDLRIRQAVLDHKAWLSVDLMGVGEEEASDDAYLYIGKLISALVDEDSLAILAPESGTVNVLDDALIDGLKGPEPLEVMKHLANPPVIMISDDDPRMIAAVAEAKRRWPEFVQAFENREEGEFFAVKKAFSDGDEVEFMWVGVTAIENNQIYGTLGNEPVNVRNVAEGDRVAFDLEELNDWNYFRNDELYGGFTSKVLAEHANEPEDQEQ